MTSRPDARARWRLAAAAAVLVVGCARPQVAAPASTVVTSAEDDALSLRLDAWASALATEGFEPSQFRTRGFLPPGARQTHAVRIGKGRCGLFVALASANVADLDAAMYTPEGEALAEDEGADSRPAILVCAADEDVEGYFTIHAYQGGGAFVARLFERSARLGDDLATVRAGEAPSELASLAKLLRKRGFADELPRVELALHDREPVRVPLHVNAGYCYTAAAAGENGLEALALRLLDASGSELAQGVGDPGVAALQYCASVSSDLALEVAATRGAGTVRLARFHAPQSMVGGAQAMWLGEPSLSAQASAAPVTRDVLAAKLGAQPSVLETHPLSQGHVFVHESRAPLGACERWELVVVPGLERATLRIESADGRVLGEAVAGAEPASLEICDRRERARVVVVGRAGFGAFTLAAARVGGDERKQPAR